MRLSEGGWIKYEIRGGKKIESDCKTGEHLGRKKGIWQACQMEGGKECPPTTGAGLCVGAGCTGRNPQGPRGRGVTAQ